MSPSLFIWSHSTVDTSFPYCSLVKRFRYQLCLSKTEKHMLVTTILATFGVLLALFFPHNNAHIKSKHNPNPLAEQRLLSLTSPSGLSTFTFYSNPDIPCGYSKHTLPSLSPTALLAGPGLSSRAAATPTLLSYNNTMLKSLISNFCSNILPYQAVY